jgi:hypothetical protein
MPRTTPRPRHPISEGRARLLPVIGFRYSASRDGYVLRAVGNRLGPVYQVAPDRGRHRRSGQQTAS